MGKIKTMIRLLKSDRKKVRKAFVRSIAGSKVSHIISDKAFLKMQYKAEIGKKLNIKNPRSFNEKLQWLKLYGRSPEQRRLVDKYDVKGYVSEVLGEEYVIKTLGVWERFDDIDFDKLPNEFVLKCTHDSGSVMLCRDKSAFDIEAAREKLSRKLKSDLFWHGREWPYKGLKHRIIAEEFLVDSRTNELRDYKFFCFGGKVKCFKVDFDRFISHKANYFDTNGNILPIGEVVCPPDPSREIEMPINLDKMVEMAEKLSVGYPFMRVDFYEVDGRIYFGEMTFFPASGFGPFTDEEWDNTLGDWIQLPAKN